MKCGRNGAAAVLVIGWWSSIDASLHVHPGGAHTPARRRDAVTGRCVSRRFRFVPALNERLGWEERQAAWDEPMEANDEAREPRPSWLWRGPAMPPPTSLSPRKLHGYTLPP